MSQHKRAKSLLLVLLVLLGLTATSFRFPNTVAAADAAELGQNSSSDLIVDTTELVEQSATVVASDGKEIKVTAAPIDEPFAIDDYYQNAGGRWNVTAESPLISRWYKIHIKDHLIVEAYDEGYSTFGCTVASATLTRTTSKANYKLGINYVGGVGSRTVELWARMEGTNLRIHAD